MKSFRQFLIEGGRLEPRWSAWLKSVNREHPNPVKEPTYRQRLVDIEDRKLDATTDKIYNAVMGGPEGVVPEPPFKGSLSVNKEIGTTAVTQGHLADITYRAPDTLIGFNKKTTSERPVHVTSFRDNTAQPGSGRFRFLIHSTRSDGTKGPIIHEVIKNVYNGKVIDHVLLSSDISISDQEAKRVTEDHWFADVPVGKNKELRAISDHHYPY